VVKRVQEAKKASEEAVAEVFMKAESMAKEARKVEEAVMTASQEALKKAETARKVSEASAAEASQKAEQVAKEAEKVALAASQEAAQKAEEALSKRANGRRRACYMMRSAINIDSMELSHTDAYK